MSYEAAKTPHASAPLCRTTDLDGMSEGGDVDGYVHDVFAAAEDDAAER